MNKEKLIDKFLVIEGDVNDGDYVTKVVRITESNVTDAMIMIKLLKLNDMNGILCECYGGTMSKVAYEKGKEIFDKYGITTEDEADDVIRRFIPKSECSYEFCHSIELFYVMEEIKNVW